MEGIQWIPQCQTFVIYASGAVVLGLLWKWSKSQRQLDLPRYKGLPLLGNVFQVRLERPELTFTDWSKDLGPVFVVKMLNMEMVVLNSFEAIYEANVTKGSAIIHRPPKASYIWKTLTEGNQCITMGRPDTHWKKVLKVCHQKIRMYDTGLKRIEEISNEMLKALVQDF
jgi:cytochrome P450 family 2 subfamily U polypeptide 1